MITVHIRIDDEEGYGFEEHTSANDDLPLALHQALAGISGSVGSSYYEILAGVILWFYGNGRYDPEGKEKALVDAACAVMEIQRAREKKGST